LIIIGGGAIGVEFAFIYHSFGTKVTIVEMMPRILPSEDEEISEALGRIYKKRGITIHAKSTVKSVDVTKKDVNVRVSMEKGSLDIRADICMVAAGITPNIDNLGLERIGVKTTGGRIVVDEFQRSSVPGIYGIGDVVGPPYLAHKASQEGMVCIKKIAGSDILGVDHHSIPVCTFCNPQVASIGMSEKEARAEGREVKVGKFPFKASGKARVIGETEGFVKMIFDARFGELLGAHILGPDATEMIAACGFAKTFEATLSEMAATVHAHPTLSEALMEATWSALGQSIHI
jgi:dihydrolipoamide dehydrogenase